MVLTDEDKARIRNVAAGGALAIGEALRGLNISERLNLIAEMIKDKPAGGVPDLLIAEVFLSTIVVGMRDALRREGLEPL